ncbi:hypothetical protein Celaphus_00015179 [Cervus elaphus hippelaphus]|uniref:Uncharacterized protein n=1 Tax=Cervus elaphus hippelaphus TaxID=46360 RepID=A0A212CSQ7_CEREH|nr:hypothetical protein Celaphus_00015179 [Cervus elaphus hippelaphus]
MQSKFPGLGKIFFGKESNEFANDFEEKIIMRLCPTEEEPVDLLSTVLNDSTYQYIKGSADIKPNQGIFPRGLQCITVLTGVYDIQTGVPLMGVINQRFVSQDLNSLR